MARMATHKQGQLPTTLCQCFVSTGKEMDTSSKTVINSNIPTPDKLTKIMPTTKDLENTTVDEKLNMLISGMLKLESVPNDILSMRNTINGIQKDIKEIPIIQQRLVTIENDVKEQKDKSDKVVKTSEAIEVSLTNTRRTSMN